MNTYTRFTMISGAAALLIGIASLSPARADRDDWRRDGDRYPVRREIRDVRGDEGRLHELEFQRECLRERRDWRGVDRLDIQIAGLRLHISNDRREVHEDIRHDRRDRDRDRYDRHDHDGYRYRG